MRLATIAACSVWLFSCSPVVCTANQTACGRKCCETGTTCTHFSDGSEACEPDCKTTRDCKVAKTCCVDTPDGPVCLSPSNSTRCLCTTAEDCTTQGDHIACTPWGNGDTITAKKSFCNANDGSSGAGCMSNCCNNPSDDCRTDNAGNSYCARQCTQDSDCGNPDAGIACCLKSNPCKNCLFACHVGGCGPCP